MNYGFGHLRLKRRPECSLLYFRVLRGLQAEFFGAPRAAVGMEDGVKEEKRKGNIIVRH